MILTPNLRTLIFECKFLHKECVGVFVRRELHSVAARVVEIDAQEGPLALDFGRHRLDRRDVEGHEGTLRVVRHQDSVVLLVHVKEPRLQISRELPLSLVGLDILHLFYTLFLGTSDDLVAFETFFQLCQLFILELNLRLFSLLIISLLLYILRSQPSRLDKLRVDMSAHVDRVLTLRSRALIFLLHLLILILLK
jgi:hypothetical protein